MAPRRVPCSNDQQASAAFQCFWNLRAAPSSVPTVPVGSKLPATSSARIAKSTARLEQPLAEQTILYLAYGSNLSAETFKGVRGIRPLSAINVHVPSLDLTFDLPGIPYKEPCFANTRYREPTTSKSDYHKDRWRKGLVGVVYEVTPSDYHKIIATEGGGGSYQDVVVPCFVIPPGTTSVDATPTGTPFDAHTLFAPSDNKRGKSVTRPDPSYAQASARYLKLITDGAEEHDLPADYMAYLYNLRPYTITTYRQSLGQALLVTTWVPIFILLFGLARHTADKDGRIPAWLVQIQAVVFRSVWAIYDGFYKKVFGDGERTIKESDDEAYIECGWHKKSIRLDT